MSLLAIRSLLSRVAYSIADRLFLLNDLRGVSPRARRIYWSLLATAGGLFITATVLGRLGAPAGFAAALALEAAVAVVLLVRILVIAADLPFASPTARRGTVARYPTLFLIVAGVLHLSSAFAPEVTYLIRVQEESTLLSVFAALCVLLAALPFWTGTLYVRAWYTARRRG